MSLLNRSAVKKAILELIKKERPHLGFTRVSAEAYPHYEAILRNAIKKDIQAHPSVGKTFKPE